MFTHKMREAGQFDLLGTAEGALNVAVDKFEAPFIQLGISHQLFVRTFYIDGNPSEEIDNLVLVGARVAQRQRHGTQGSKTEFRRLRVRA